MAKITISDLTHSPNSESFFTELNELTDPDMTSLMGNIIGGACTTTTTYRRNGSVRSVTTTCG
jgi:hypothetical protein